ncbi:FAS1-like dehydratase domain-containing protein [Sphingomonas sp. SRS2]|uniref:FAS1-like dehydratase domain-containing protein n=1 Tax=Sphingomonas sp. SRS2 TaxID=133190 RepID=UPI000B17E6EA|nr:MaoC family dehydratase N-terminal domain-containing protein [Sphingomonas sp. SRS2]
MDIEHLKSWIGREERVAGSAAPEPLAGLAALLDHDDASPWQAGEVPPLGHWLYFLPRARQSDIGEDGHPRTGGFLPPVPLPRRMWAGGGVTFHAPIMIGEPIERVSTIVDVAAKSGASGDMVFVTVGHRISIRAGLAIEERQDIVYRAPADSSAAPPPPAAAKAPGETAEPYHADPVRLFRYSALTFNSHRIHYDRDYARHVEGYPGLVVHGPYQATLLIDLYLRRHPGARARSFEFRARAPLFDGADATLNLTGTARAAEAWTAGPAGAPAMTATIEGE